MSEAEYERLETLMSTCEGLRMMIRGAEEAALADIQFDELAAVLHNALDTAVVIADDYQCRAEKDSMELHIDDIGYDYEQEYREVI